ncbi:unnamed protein product, partial [Phaeothamnion confervicola]
LPLPAAAAAAAGGGGLSRASERLLERYRETAVDASGRPRVVRTDRVPTEAFDFDEAYAELAEYCAGDANGGDGGDSGDGGGSSSGGNDGDGAGGGDGGNNKSTAGAGAAGVTAAAAKAGSAAGSGAMVNTLGPVAATTVLDLPRRCICALGPLFGHLRRFRLARVFQRPTLTPFASAAYVALDAVTLRDLEVLACQADGREAGSLLWLLNRTATPGGYRTLREWVTRPLLQRDAILARQEAVTALAFDPPRALEPLLATLKRGGCGGGGAVGGGNLDASIASLHHRNIHPRRLHTLLTVAAALAAALPPPDAV